MSDPEPAEQICKTCWMYSSLPGERTGHCYEHETTVKAEQFRCDDWSCTYPEKYKV